MSDDTLTSPAPSTPGQALAAARTARGMTVPEIAMRLKFAPRQIEALEADYYEVLAGPAFVRGMVRGYAKIVGLDADALVAALPPAVAASGPAAVAPPALEVPFPRVPRRGSLVYLTLSILLVVAVAGVLVEWLLRPDPRPAPIAVAPASSEPAAQQPEPDATATVPTAVEAAIVDAAAVPAPRERRVDDREEGLSGKRIELVFNSKSWVEVRDANGRVLFSQLNPPGTRREVAGPGPFSLVIGNAAGVRVRYNDSDVDLKPFTRTDVARLKLE